MFYGIIKSRIGYLFQDRFKSEPVDDNIYFLTDEAIKVINSYCNVDHGTDLQKLDLHIRNSNPVLMAPSHDT